MNDGSGSATGWRGVGLRLGAHRLVVPLAAIAEVRAMPALARVPGARDWLLGVGNANGRLLTVTDLGRYTGTGACAVPGAQVVVVERAGHLSGLAVDEVTGVDTFEQTEQTPGPCDAPPRLAACLGPLVRGSGEEPRRVLDLHALVMQSEFVQAGAAR